MKVSIVPSDGQVYVEGEALEVDLSDLPHYVHAVQWDGSHGEVEFKKDDKGRRVPNLRFEDFTPFEYLVDRWRQKRRVMDERAKRDKEEKDAEYAKAKEAEEKSRSEKPL